MSNTTNSVGFTQNFLKMFDNLVCTMSGGVEIQIVPTMIDGSLHTTLYVNGKRKDTVPYTQLFSILNGIKYLS